MSDQNRLQQQLSFILEIDRLKSVIRQTHNMDGRRENSAEHSWQLALMALTLAEYASTPVDVAQVLRLVLVHDVVEIDAGDTFAYDLTGYGDKDAREQAAATRIFGLLPPEQAAQFQALWEEFEARETPEAQFANALDRIMPMLLNYHTGGGSWQAHRIRRSQVMQRAAPIQQAAPQLYAYLQTLLEQAISEGLLADDEAS